MAGLNRDQVIDLLYYLGASKVVNRDTKDNIQFCCPIHGESNPSAGISINKQTYNCFSCHSTGSISWLIVKSMPDDFKSTVQADKFLKERYGVDFKSFDREWEKGIKRYEDLINRSEERERLELPIFKLAPFKSGKQTYDYFFSRGFTKKTMQEFMIGRDIIQRTVTIPVFWEDNVLAGCLGRFIDKRPHNYRYHIYFDTPTGSMLFPANKFISVNDTIILVEGVLDALWCHQLGFTNVVATLTNSISNKQAEWVRRNCNKVIDMSDNDEMGNIATQKYKERLKGLTILSAKNYYPADKKDPCECTKDEIEFMIKNATSLTNKKLRRL